MSLQKFGFQKPKERCKDCFKSNTIDTCKGCSKTICSDCFHFNDNILYCKDCHKEVEKGLCY